MKVCPYCHEPVRPLPYGYGDDAVDACDEHGVIEGAAVYRDPPPITITKTERKADHANES